MKPESKDLLVFMIQRDSVCAECGDELWRGRFITLEEKGAQILEHFPRCPEAAAGKIAQHACEKYSGRVGRSAAAKEFAPQTIMLAVRAHVRHQYTNYGELLSRGHDRHEARTMIEGKVERILGEWQKGKDI